jgi:hypothetical protein
MKAAGMADLGDAWTQPDHRAESIAAAAHRVDDGLESRPP